MTNVFSKSKYFNLEYCCTVVKIGELMPVEGSDFLARTLVNGEPIVVRKDQVTEGDIMVYAANETQLDYDFLSKNNLYEIGSRELNSNYKEVEKMRSVDEEKAKRMVGFFNKNGRVRAIKLRGALSRGYLFAIKELETYDERFRDVNLEDYLGEDFDLIFDNLFVKAYIPANQRKANNGPKGNKRDKKLKKLDRMVEGQFAFHYDTAPLKKTIAQFKPSDIIDVSVKRHGTSGIFANVKVKNFIKLPIHKRLWNKICDSISFMEKHRITDYYIDYGNVFSSRNVIKNKNYNPDVTDGFYGSNDVWGWANDILMPHLGQGTTVYCEIYGYVPGTTQMIQKNYDYGCAVGETKIMPYRITTEMADNKKFEWNVQEVYQWTKKLIADNPELSDKIDPINILYHGAFGDMYPGIDTENHWHENVLQAMMTDKKRLGMECEEVECKYHKVWREGVVIRKVDDELAEAFKLKCDNFMESERALIDAGEVDMEMEQTTEE